MKNVYLDPGHEQKMDEIYVVLSSDENGEGIVSAITQMGAMPMVFGHKRMLDLIRGQVKQISKETGKKLLVVKYIKTEVIEEIG